MLKAMMMQRYDKIKAEYKTFHQYNSEAYENK